MSLSSRRERGRKKERKGKERKGKERKGKERKGKERKGKERKKERKGKERKGKERKGKERKRKGKERERKGKERKGKERKGKERNLETAEWRSRAAVDSSVASICPPLFAPGNVDLHYSYRCYLPGCVIRFTFTDTVTGFIFQGEAIISHYSYSYRRKKICNGWDAHGKHFKRGSCQKGNSCNY